MRFSHLDDNGTARMVDVSAKSPTKRTARAGAEISLDPKTIDAIRLSQSRSVNPAESIRRTDAALGIGRFWLGGRESRLMLERPEGGFASDVALACSRGAAKGNDKGAEHA